MFAHWGLAADGTLVVAMARTCGCGDAFTPDTVFCNACGVRHHAVKTANTAATAAAPAAASDARAPPGGASSLFGGVASGDRGGAGGAWSSSPLESNSWPSINVSKHFGASSLDGCSLGNSINEGASRGGDDARPLGTSEPTNRTTTTTTCTRPSSGRPGRSTASCRPAGRSCRPACARGSFRTFFWGDCAAKVEALDVGSQGYLDLGRPSGRSERIGHSV